MESSHPLPARSQAKKKTAFLGSQWWLTPSHSEEKNATEIYYTNLVVEAYQFNPSKARSMCFTLYFPTHRKKEGTANGISASMCMASDVINLFLQPLLDDHLSWFAQTGPLEVYCLTKLWDSFTQKCACWITKYIFQWLRKNTLKDIGRICPCNTECRFTDAQMRDPSKWECTHDFGEMDTMSFLWPFDSSNRKRNWQRRSHELSRGADLDCEVENGLPKNVKKNFHGSPRDALSCLLVLFFSVSLINGQAWWLSARKRIR